MTFDGRARNRYVNFSRDVVPLVRLKGLTLIVHYRRETPRNRRPVKKFIVAFSLWGKKKRKKQRAAKQHSYKPYPYKSHYEWKGIETSRRGLLIRDNYLLLESPFQEKSARMINGGTYSILARYSSLFSSLHWRNFFQYRITRHVDVTSPSIDCFQRLSTSNLSVSLKGSKIDRFWQADRTRYKHFFPFS